MARPIYLYLPSLAVFALSACGGSETGFFSPSTSGGTGSSSHAGASSVGGSTASAGSPGSAGSAAGAGNLGSAGQDEAGDGSGGAQTGGAGNSGGAAGNSGGGRAGASARGGAGGRTGAGGSGAAAGHAGSNSGGAGGGGANQDAACNELVKLATQQLEAARACNVAVNSLQCTGSVKTVCNCEVPVQRDASSETKAYLETLKKIKDQDCVQVCPAVACTQVTDAHCRESSSSSSTGSCVASHGSLP